MPAPFPDRRPKLTDAHESAIYARLRIEVDRLQRLRNWLAVRVYSDDTILHAIDDLLATTIRAADACTRGFDKKEHSRHRKWMDRFRS